LAAPRRLSLNPTIVDLCRAEGFRARQDSECSENRRIRRDIRRRRHVVRMLCLRQTRRELERPTPTNGPQLMLINAGEPERPERTPIKSVQSNLRGGFHSRSFAPSAIGCSPDEAGRGVAIHQIVVRQSRDIRGLQKLDQVNLVSWCCLDSQSTRAEPSTPLPAIRVNLTRRRKCRWR
jgi:hypothetical protein